MGADGSITIFHLGKVYKKYGTEKTEKFLELMRDSMSYTQEFKTPEGAVYPVLTTYRGDNLMCEFLNKQEMDDWEYL